MQALPTTGEEVLDDAACGKLFRELRESKNLTLRIVAVALDISPQYLADLELGRRKWSRELGKRVSEAIKLATKAAARK